MAILHPKPPKEGREILSSKLNKSIRSGDFAAVMPNIPSPEALAVAEPHQVFFVGLEDLVRGKLLSAARMTGWRYLLIDGEKAVGEAVLGRVEGKEGLQLLYLTAGPFSEATIKGLNFAEKLNEVQKNDYEPCFLNIPAVYLAALWLHGKKDIIIPLTNIHDELKSNKAYSEDEIIAVLQKEAIRVRDFEAKKRKD